MQVLGGFWWEGSPGKLGGQDPGRWVGDARRKTCLQFKRGLCHSEVLPGREELPRQPGEQEPRPGDLCSGMLCEWCAHGKEVKQGGLDSWRNPKNLRFLAFGSNRWASAHVLHWTHCPVPLQRSFSPWGMTPMRVTHRYVTRIPKAWWLQPVRICYRTKFLWGQESWVVLSQGLSWGCRQSVGQSHLQAWGGWRGPRGLTLKAPGRRPQFLVTWGSPQGYLSIFTTQQLASPRGSDPRRQARRKPHNFYDPSWESYSIISATCYSLRVSLSIARVQGEDNWVPPPKKSIKEPVGRF